VPNVLRFRFGDDAIAAPQIEDESVRIGDISAGRRPIYDRKRAQSGVDRGGDGRDAYVGRFLGSFANDSERGADPIRVALKGKMDNLIAVVLRRARKVVFDSLFHDHRPEAHPLVIAGDGSRNGLDLLAGRAVRNGAERERREDQRCETL
jgi:hypothetical protein